MRRTWVVVTPAALAGLAIAYVDSRPHWDDTGVTALAILVVSGLLAAWSPSNAWLSALLVGGFVPAFEIAGSRSYGSLLALVFAAVGAVVGAAISPARATRAS